MAITYTIYYGTAAATNNGTNALPTGWTQFGNPTTSLTSVVTGLATTTSYYFMVVPTDTVTGLKGPPTVTGPWVTSQTGESANDTELTGATGSIIDASGNTWTLVASATDPPFVVAMNGSTAAVAPTGFVVLLVYFNHVVYQENTGGLWWSWTAGAWAVASDPRPAPPPPPPVAGAIPLLQARTQNPRPTFADSANIVWGISCMCQVMFGTQTTILNGTATIDTNTSSVVQMVLVNNGATIMHQNIAGNWFSKTASSSPGIVAWTSASNPLPAGQAHRVRDFQRTTGVVAHPAWTPNSPPANIYGTAFAYTGLSVMRVGAFDFIGNGATRMAACMAAGAKFLIGEVTNGNVGVAMGVVSPSQIAAFECDNEPMGGGVPATTTRANDATLGAQIAADSRLRNVVPATTFSSWFGGDMTATLNYSRAVGDETAIGLNWAHWHGYTTPPVGDPASPSINGPPYAVQDRDILTPGRPFIIGEWGYNPTFDGNVNDTFAPAATNALGKMVMCYFLDAYLYGSALTTWFDMFHEIVQEGGADWSIFNDDGSPHIGTTYVHNMMQILLDTGPNAINFSPGNLSVSFSNIGTGANTVRHLIFQKQAGVFAIPMWNEPAVQSAGSATNWPTDISPAPTNATVTFGQAVSAVRCDPTVGQGTLQNYGNIAANGSVSVPVAGYPQILLVTPA